jgi:hypothetical protein
VLSLSACTYSLDGFYENKVDKNVSPPNITVVNLDLENDTVFAYSDRKINFKFQTDNQAIQGAKLLVDGIVIDSVAAAEGQFKFQSYYITNGNHSLELRIYTRSGTGSIADKLSNESWTLSNKWVLVVDNDLSNNLKYIVKDGFLHIISNKRYKASDFVSYVLKRGSWPPVIVAENQQQDIVDSTYVGEGSEFQMFVKQTDGSLLYWGELKMPYELSEVHLGTRSDKDYYLWWHRSRFYSAMKGYKFSLKYNVFTESNNEADTVLNLPNVRFKDYIDFVIQYVPNPHNPFYSSSASNFNRYYSDYAALKLKTTDNYSYNTKQSGVDEICWTYNDTIYKYNMSNLNYTSKKRVFEGYSSYGTTSAHADYFMGYYAPTANNFRYFARNMKTGKITYLDSYASYSGGISQNLPISDNGIALIMNFQYETGYDMENNSNLIYHSHVNKTSTSMKISSEGKYYMYNSDSLYVYTPRKGTSDVEQIMSLGKFYTTDFFQFNTENPNQIVITAGQKLTVYQCQPFGVVLSMNLPQGEEVLCIDYYNNEILCGNTNVYRVRSLITGELIYELPVSSSPHRYDYNYLVNHNLICYLGYYIKLNY